MIVPSGSLIATGYSATFLFTTGAPSSRKWALAPESEMANFTMLVSFLVLNMVDALGRSISLLACTIFAHAPNLVVGTGIAGDK